MNEISTAELITLRASKTPHTLLDCRGPDYFRWEHILGAKNLRWKYIESRAREELPDLDQVIVTYCQSYLCKASVRGYQALEKIGYRNLREYSAGVDEWQAQGLPVTFDPQARVNARTYRFVEQSFYGERVGCYLIDAQDKLVLVDPPQTLSEEIEDFLLSFDKPLHCFLTHDATGGSAEQLRTKHGAKVYLHAADKAGEWLRVRPTQYIEDGFSFGDGLTVVHTPGHTPGSSCLFDEKERALFSGDYLAADEPDGALLPFEAREMASRSRAQWAKNLQRIRELEPLALFPFHYGMVRSELKQKLESI